MRRVALLSALATAACADDPGTYDTETVLALVRERGDARGVRHTGDWLADVELRECDCPLIMLPVLGAGVDPCVVLTPTGSVASLVEADGVLRLSYSLMQLGIPGLPTGFELLGPLDEDGAFRLGQVTSASATLFETRIVVRADGTLTDHEPPILPPEPRSELEAELVARLHAKALDVTIDCALELELSAQTSSLEGPD